MATEFTSGNFAREVLRSEVPVLVDFWATWCGPCRMIAPTIEELDRESGGRYRVGKVNVDQNPALASQFGISAIPTLLIFRGGRVVDGFQGVQPKRVLAGALEDALRAGTTA